MKNIFAFLSLLLICSSLLAQQVISGKVLDNNGQPLSDVSVKSKKTNNGTISGRDGSFRLQVAANDELEISMIGFVNQSVQTGSEANITVRLVPSETELSQIVLVG